MFDKNGILRLGLCWKERALGNELFGTHRICQLIQMPHRTFHSTRMMETGIESIVEADGNQQIVMGQWWIVCGNMTDHQLTVEVETV